MQTIKALREFEYNGKKYLKDQLYQVDAETSKYLYYRGLAVFVLQVQSNTSVTFPLEGETKELKKETVKKPFPVSKRK